MIIQGPFLFSSAADGAITFQPNWCFFMERHYPSKCPGSPGSETKLQAQRCTVKFVGHEINMAKHPQKQILKETFRNTCLDVASIK